MNRHSAGAVARPTRGTAFSSAADAWFWTIMALRSRHDGARGGGGALERPCEPDDVMRCVDRLYRNRQIGLGHAQVLRRWGERQVAPDQAGHSSEDARLWREALDCLEAPLRRKGIVRG